MTTRSVAAACVLPLLAPALLRAQQAPAAGAPGHVHGSVVDSLSGRALGGASVMLVHADDPAAPVVHVDADSLGRFRLDSVAAGEYYAGFQDALLDSLRIEAPVRRIDVPAGHDVRLDLATPSIPTLRQAYCGARADSANFGVVVGELRDAATHDALAGGQVVAHTPVVGLKDGRLQMNLLEVTVTTGADGAFFVCGLPAGRAIDVVATHGADSSGTFTLDLPATGLLVHDAVVGASTGGTVTGRITAAGGAPLPGAHVVVDGTARTAVSDSSGRFVIRGAPLGTRTLYARAIGFFPEQRIVDVFADGAAPVELALPTMLSVLDTIHVYGQRVFREWQGFDQRRRMGFGTFLQHAQVERLRPVRTTDILHTVPGVFLARAAAGELLAIRGSDCLPSFVLDGHPIRLLESVDEIDNWVRPEEVQGMEVYIGTDAPAEYVQPGMPSCATILVWTNPAFSMPIPK